MKEYRMYECKSIDQWREGKKDKVLLITNDLSEYIGALKLLNAINTSRDYLTQIWVICEEEEL